MRLVLLASLIALCAWPQLLLRQDPLALSTLAVPDSTKALLRSGYDYNDGNYDSGNLIRVEPAGKVFTDPDSEWVLFDAAGPGAITSIWLTGKSKTGKAYIGGNLKFYFDGEKTASNVAHLPELFEDGKLLPHPLAEKSSGGWVSYVPIYFAKHLKITVADHQDSYTHRKNARGEDIPHIYHQLSYQKLALPVRSTRFGERRFQPWMTVDAGNSISSAVELREDKWTPVIHVQGRGVLTNLRLRWTVGAPEEASIQVRADGANSLEMKVSELWGFDLAKRPDAKFQSAVMGIEKDGTHYLNFPMPCRTDLQISLRGKGSVNATISHEIGWSEKELFYFRASRVRDTTRPGRDIKILEASGRGHYVGTILELADKTMEGDDRFYM
ncbi:MAG: DUF2961 domain-containing protein [Acidobacteriota bacterium]|nr:DUF2961 domain-containing protein [Acidobacteriota bacterium]